MSLWDGGAGADELAMAAQTLWDSGTTGPDELVMAAQTARRCRCCLVASEANMAWTAAAVWPPRRRRPEPESWRPGRRWVPRGLWATAIALLERMIGREASAARAAIGSRPRTPQNPAPGFRACDLGCTRQCAGPKGKQSRRAMFLLGLLPRRCWLAQLWLIRRTRSGRRLDP